jgi:hypothetical protein
VRCGIQINIYIKKKRERKKKKHGAYHDKADIRGIASILLKDDDEVVVWKEPILRYVVVALGG